MISSTFVSHSTRITRYGVTVFVLSFAFHTDKETLQHSRQTIWSLVVRGLVVQRTGVKCKQISQIFSKNLQLITRVLTSVPEFLR